MDLRRFVRVEVERRDGTKTWGTGYLADRDRVLTSGHVVEEAAAVAVRLQGATGPLDAQVLWWRAEKRGRDAAILSVALDEAAPCGVVLLARELPKEDVGYVSRGYARAGKETGVELCGLVGRITAPAADALRFEITVEAPAVADGWKGASGASLFTGGQLIGLVSEIPTGFNGGRLDAVSLPMLLQDPEFSGHLRFGEERQACSERFATEVRRALASAPLLVQALRSSNAGGRVDGWSAGLEGDSDAESLIARFLVTSARTVLTVLDVCHRELGMGALRQADTKPSEVDQAVRAAEHLIDRLVPLVTAVELLQRFPGGRGGLVGVPTRRDSVLELVMAGLDGRRSRWKELQSDRADPSPEALLDLPAFDTGLDVNDAGAFGSWLEALERRFLFTEDIDALKSEFPGTSPKTSEERQNACLRYLNTEFEGRAARHREDPLRYYLVLSGLPDGARAYWKRRLEGRLPALWYPEKEGTSGLEDRAFTTALRNYLGRRQGLPKGKP
jgi:hypothetical protein